jgi:hypothetical protein
MSLRRETVQPHYLVDSSKNYRKMNSNEQITTASCDCTGEFTQGLESDPSRIVSRHGPTFL